MTTKFNQIFKASINNRFSQEEFYRQTKRLVLSVLIKYCTKRETLEDAFQDCILKLYARHGELFDSKKCSIEKYLIIMTKNRYLDLIRNYGDARMKPIEHFDKEFGWSYAHEPVNYATPEYLFIREELRTQTRKAVTKLPEHFRQIITAKYFKDRDNIEIGQMLNMNPNSVPVYQHRALQKLRKLLSTAYY